MTPIEASLSPAPPALALLPPATMRARRVCPLRIEDDVLHVARDAPLPPALRHELAFLTGKTLRVHACAPDTLDALLDAHAPDAPRPAPSSDAPRFGRGPQPAGSVVRQVDDLIRQAVGLGASDLHVEPYETVFRVRVRLDGVLQPFGELSLLQKNGVISRLKIMAGLDIAEKRRPQDGRIRFRTGERTVDLRVSTLPTGFGEKVALRILDRRALRLNLDALGFRPDDLRAFRRHIHRPHGMILVTGPTGSGKTTTLYAALEALNTPARNITTVEDPIEYNLPGINQTHVRADIGLTFARALRAFLRQDPDVIMVGEIRDRETAEIAVRAALTGHLVLSTLHTNDAPSAVTRLTDMGIEPFLVASSLRLVLAQRLARRICPDCKTEAPPNPARRADPSKPVYHGRGCAHCTHTGYRGRIALFELMAVDEPLAACIARGAPVQALREQARRTGWRPLQAHAREHVAAGRTTVGEMIRVTSDE